MEALASKQWVPNVKIYDINSSEGYELCHPIREDDFGRINALIDGTERARTWSPIKMQIVTNDLGHSLRESDSPWLESHALIFRQRAIDALRPLLEANGELLPLSCDDADLWTYNPTHVLDALDVSASETKRFGDGRIILIDRHVFRPEFIQGVEIFKLSCLRVSPTFVGKAFVDAWKSARLRGLEFTKVWEGKWT